MAEDVEASIQRQEEGTAAKTCQLLLTADEGRRYYAFDGTTLDATAPEVIAAADRTMKDPGYLPVGDVVASHFSSNVHRGYAKKGGDTWAKFIFEACSSDIM